MLNKVCLIGRVGKDPETRFTSGGQAVANFSLATDESYKKDGERVQKTEWHRIVVWGKLAEIVQQYVKKGMLIYLEGKLQTREWEDKRSGDKRQTTEIVAFQMKMLEKKKDGAAAAASAPSSAASSTVSDFDEERVTEIDDSDIPF